MIAASMTAKNLTEYFTWEKASDANGPQITELQWVRATGQSHVSVTHQDGTVHTYKDCMVYPEGSEEWNWRESEDEREHTHHRPGIVLFALKRLLEKGDIEEVVLSQGVDGVLKTTPEVSQELARLKNEKKINNYYILLTEEAVDKYNELNNQDKAVGILVHSTC